MNMLVRNGSEVVAVRCNHILGGLRSGNHEQGRRSSVSPTESGSLRWVYAEGVGEALFGQWTMRRHYLDVWMAYTFVVGSRLGILVPCHHVPNAFPDVGNCCGAHFVPSRHGPASYLAAIRAFWNTVGKHGNQVTEGLRAILFKEATSVTTDCGPGPDGGSPQPSRYVRLSHVLDHNLHEHFLSVLLLVQINNDFKAIGLWLRLDSGSRRLWLRVHDVDHAGGSLAPLETIVPSGERVAAICLLSVCHLLRKWATYKNRGNMLLIRTRESSRWEAGSTKFSHHRSFACYLPLPHFK